MPTVTRTPKIELVPVTPVEPGTGFYDYWMGLKDRIAKCAYQIFESRGKTHGHDIDDWLKAENQIVKRVAFALNEAWHLYTVTVDASGFLADELDVRVEPFRIFITGSKRDSAKALPVSAAEEIFQPIDLSQEIETNTVIAELSNGELTISMRKAFAPAVVKHPRPDSKGLQTRSVQLRKQADLAKHYSAEAKDQLRRATATGRKTRTRASANRKEAKERSKHETPNSQPNVPWAEEAPHSPLG